ENNTADQGSGAIQSQVDGNATIADCTFTGNRTTSSTAGGAGAVEAFGACAVYACGFVGDTTGRLGGALWINSGRATVTGCTFDANSASFGGALAISRDSTATVNNCLFTRNTISTTSRPASALWVGDGIGGPSTATVVNCTFAGNTAPA